LTSSSSSRVSMAMLGLMVEVNSLTFKYSRSGPDVASKNRGKQV
jgi:hypothetical protein